MKLAFLVQCHKFTSSLSYTVNKLRLEKEIDIYIHVDLKSNLSDFESLFNYSNVFFISERLDVNWGGFSQILVALNLLNEVKENAAAYISFLSGDDIFYQSINRFKAFLRSNYGLEFIGINNFNNSTTFLNRVNYRYPHFFFKKDVGLMNRLLRFMYTKTFSLHKGTRKNISSLKTFYKGSNWFTLSGECISNLLDKINSEPEILERFKFSFCGDEMFFQTLIMNSSYKKNVYLLSSREVTDNEMSLRYIDWISGPEYPKVFTEPELYKGFPEECFFLRKVSEDISIDTLKHIFG
jgi:hypothetical protein